MNGPKTGSERDRKLRNHPDPDETGGRSVSIIDVPAFSRDAFASKKQRVTERVKPLLNSGTAYAVYANPAEI